MNNASFAATALLELNCDSNSFQKLILRHDEYLMSLMYPDFVIVREFLWPENEVDRIAQRIVLDELMMKAKRIVKCR